MKRNYKIPSPKKKEDTYFFPKLNFSSKLKALVILF